MNKTIFILFIALTLVSSTYVIAEKFGYNTSSLPKLIKSIYCENFGNCKVNNLVITGNFSAKRPYWDGYDNSTQYFQNTANVQVINISNNADYDNYLIEVIGNQNLTFKQTGNYLCILSPEFFQNGGGALITFWYQKNGVDAPWSNSRYTMTNNEYHAPAIPYQFDIYNTTTDNIRFIWWSDSTNTQIYSSGALTAPTRPNIPGILLHCQKVSEII